MDYNKFLTHFPDYCIQLFDDAGVDKSKAKTIAGVNVNWDNIKQANHEGAGVFFSVNKFPEGIRRTANCKGINAWFAESDSLSIEEQQKNLDSLELQPSFIVKSKKSLHAYWLASDGTMDNFKLIQQWLAKKLNGDMSISDYTRVLRVPEFYHVKDYSDPVQIKIIKSNPELVYTEQQMLDYFVDFEQIKKEEEAQIQKIKDITAKFSGAGDTYSAINQIPIEKIVAEAMGWGWDGKKHWFASGSQAPSACFKSNEGNYVVHGGTQHFSDEQIGYNPFSFIKMINGLNDKDTFEWFMTKYPEIKDIDDKGKKDWSKEQNKNEHDEAMGSLVNDKPISNEMFKIYKSHDILKMTASHVPFIVDRMIAEKTITAITAKSGVGKSLFSLILATHIANGEKLFGEFDILQKNVLIVDQEMPDDILIDRYKAIVKIEVNVDYMWQQSWLVEDENHFNWIKEQIYIHNYGVIIFDMLDSIHEKNENDNSEMKVINKKLIRLINETGVTIVVLHQHRKEDNKTKSSQDSAQGAGEIIHKASSHLIIEQLNRGKDEENKEEVTDYLLKQVKSRRPETMPSFKFDVAYGLETKLTRWGFISFHDDKLEATQKARNLILEHLQNNPGIWYIKSSKYKEFSLYEILKKQQIGESNLREAMKNLLKENLVNSTDTKPVGYFVE